MNAFSTENWSRTKKEVTDLQKLLEITLKSEIAEINANDINQWNAIGRPDIATFLTSVLSGEAQPNPPIIDEDGNQTFDFDGEGGQRVRNQDDTNTNE